MFFFSASPGAQAQTLNACHTFASQNGRRNCIALTGRRGHGAWSNKILWQWLEAAAVEFVVPGKRDLIAEERNCEVAGAALPLRIAQPDGNGLAADAVFLLFRLGTHQPGPTIH